MNMRKHYLDDHRSGIAVQIAAIAEDHAAINEGERVELIGGHAVSVLGDPDRAEIERFAADVALIAQQDGRAAAA